MSKITLTPNASGTGTFTIQSPATDTNRTFTLPDEDGELSVGGGGGFTYAAVTGATQDLDLDNGNFFDAGTLTGDTTLTFSNVPTQMRWEYKYAPATTVDNTLDGASLANFVLEGVTGSSRGLAFNHDGTKFYTVSSSTDSVDQYDLTTAYEISTATLTSNTLNVNAQMANPYAILLNADSTKIFMGGFGDAGDNYDKIYQYTLSTAGDLSTAGSASIAFNMGTARGSKHLYGMCFGNNGTKFYFTNLQTKDVIQCSLSTAYDISTASYDSKFFDYGGEDVWGVEISSDGTSMYLGNNSSDLIQQYTLSTAFDVSTATFARSVSTPAFYGGNQLTGLRWASSDDSKLLALDQSQRKVYQVFTGTKASLTLPSSVTNPSAATDVALDQRAIYEFLTTDAGTNVLITGESIT